MFEHNIEHYLFIIRSLRSRFLLRVPIILEPTDYAFCHFVINLFIFIEMYLLPQQSQ